MDSTALLINCDPEYWYWLPRPIRRCLAWITISAYSLSFLSIPLSTLFLLPSLWVLAPKTMGTCAVLIATSLIMPLKEWPWIRKIGQLWYDEFQLRCNLSKEKRELLIESSEKNQYILSTHPHGIIPIHAILWTSFCDQYLTKPDGGTLYGFGAAADVVFYTPFLRNILSWLSAGSASYKTLKNGLLKGGSSTVSSGIPRHLFILPGGIAEVFTSMPGTQVIVFKARKGLVRLSLETGAQLVPGYVFGVTDLFCHFPILNSLRSYLSRRFRMGMAPFYGQYGLPIPFPRRLTMVFADPIPVERWTGDGPVPQDAVDALHLQYITSIQALFDKYKAVAGFPDAQLEIR